VNVFGKVAGFAADKAVGEGMIRVTLDGYDPSALDLGQQTAGVGTIFGANRTFPHGRSPHLSTFISKNLAGIVNYHWKWNIIK
jgi:hypothetical protein